MTVSNTDSSITYTGNGATTVFPYAFLIPTSGDAEVVVYDSVTMTEVILTVGVDCTITGTGSVLGGDVTYNPSGVPIPATKTITIRRVLELTQTLDLTRQSNSDPTSLEAALDRIVMMIQQINTVVTEDALIVPVGSSLTVEDLLDATTAAQAAVIAAQSAATTANAAADAAAASAAAAAAFDPSLYLTKADNLSSVASKPAALTNLGAVAKAGDTMTGALIYAAGTTALAPANFQSGPVKTTAAAGDMEFDGKAFYLNAVASSRQAVVAQQLVVAAAAVPLSNSSTSAQNIFAAANDVLTVQASTTYFFEALLLLTTGTTSHTDVFSLGGTATFTSVMMHSVASGMASINAGTTSNLNNVSNTASINALGATTSPVQMIRVFGTFRVNAGGAVIPQITFSAGPTGTCQTEPNSYFRCWPVGSDAVAAIGNWA